MEFKKFTAGQDDNDRRFDRVIRKFIPQNTLSQVYKCIRKGLIKINDKKASPETKIKQGDVISVAEFLFKADEATPSPHPQASSIPTIPAPLDIVFQNEHLLLINKPYDVTVHGSKDSLDKIVQLQFPSKDSLSFTPGPLHRLDRKTTGLLAFSQSLTGAQWFSKNIQTHTIQKTYIAVLQGNITKEEHWQDFIQKDDESKNGFHTVKIVENNTANSETFVSPLCHGTFENIPFTLSKILITTGKTHQIRAQSAAHNHPLLGDTSYGGKKLPEQYYDFFLQACSLSFPKDNPLGLPEHVDISLNENLNLFLKDCGLSFLGI